MSTLLASAVGAVASACSVISFAPQLLKILRDHDVSAVSLRMYLVTVVGFSIWIVYGLMIASWPIVVSNSASLCLSAAILALKWRLSKRASG
jgi:MtN3 and saliva related transmembrane protein